ncbi:hypothetical protein LTR56_022673 [Elasticomyces elasticus]|uniref:Uncharacterized protein n=1 Tax=Elasticomyces elasticus TaxID=574655 RepID=A0AAN7WCE7_9PEZI|nr:hypothetical protein LTR56_022673 [Elasticomyces elasticus]KAK3625959.1 hypothetical protein LTR22_023359 [Elasticomyces elasticus]KAK4906863.1 hypothetical protein LTR49_024069 [Elasticomyces elasticus]KAK5700992.1 hypothetical protein LTR97_005511 [Elasticomyces elasticus]KAK5728747.1 hypothetical protein LTR15_001886 [Elasticomyces elasticus]
MKIAAISTLLFAAAAMADSDEDRCRHRKGGGHTVTAIKNFCGKTDMVVPSQYAQNGKWKNNAHAFISGNCSPAQWVPQYWCEKQFLAMCANGPWTENAMSQRFGNNGCQTFALNK